MPGLRKRIGRASLPQLAGLLVFMVLFGALGIHLLVSSHASPSLPGDINNDGVVNEADLQIIRDNYGQTGASANQGDLNDDGSVNIIDASILFSNWGGTNTIPTSIPMGIAPGAGNPTPDEMDAYQTAGASFVRIGLGWDQGSTNTDADFDKPQAVGNVISYANSIHLKVILLINASEQYKGHQFVHNADFAKFVANVAAYFNGTDESSHKYVMAFEVGNEPNINRFDNTTDTIEEKAAGYADLMIRVYDPLFENIKARTTRPVIIGGMARTGEPLTFTQDLHSPITVDGHSFPDGILGHYDGWTFHPYDYYQTASSDLDRGNGGMYDLKQTMNWLQSTYHISPPLYITEYGEPTYPEDAAHFAQQACYMNDAVYQLTKLQSQYGWDVRALAWYRFENNDNASTNSNDHFGITEKTSIFPIPDSVKKPSYDTYKAITGTHRVSDDCINQP